MRKPQTIWLVAMLTSVATVSSAEIPAIDLPPNLMMSARRAGSYIEAAQVEEGAADGLLDRTGSRVLHVSRVALDAAESPEEKTALLAIALSYKVGIQKPEKTGAARAGDLLARMAAADIDETIAGRERADPNLKLPASTRRWEPQPAAQTRLGLDPVAIRGLAWAKSAGVCERTSIALLTRIGSNERTNSLVAMDARAVLKGLGSLRFNPDERC